MKTLACPIPSNINNLQSNGFMFTINKMPDIAFFCQEATLPDIDMQPAIHATPLIDYPQPGDKMQFGPLQIQFAIDENMDNYKMVADWLMGLGFPKSHSQYTNWINSHKTFPTDGEAVAATSDAVLQILGSSNRPVKTIMFRDVFPTSLNSLQLLSTNSDTRYLFGQATFIYSYYEFS